MPFHHYSTIGLVVLVVPKSFLVNHLRYGLGTNFFLESSTCSIGQFRCLCS
jgi:hypothetical protein